MRCSVSRVAASLLLLAGATQAQEGSLEFASCLIRPAESTELSSPLREIVSARRADLGDAVEAGDVLLEFSHAALDARAARLENERAFAARALARAERLGNMLPAAERDELTNALRRAEADLAEIRAEIARYTISAPHAGIVTEAPLSIGEVAGDEPVMTLIQVSRLRAELSVPAAEHGRFAIGDRLMLAAENGTRKAGEITFVDPAIDFGSRTFRIHAEVDNSDGGWVAGMGCQVPAG